MTPSPEATLPNSVSVGIQSARKRFSLLFLLGFVAMFIAQWTWSFLSASTTLIGVSAVFLISGLLLGWKKARFLDLVIFFLPQAMVHGIALYANPTVVPLIVPLLTIVGILSLLLGYLVTTRFNNRNGIMVLLLYFGLIGFFGTTALKKLHYMHRNTVLYGQEAFRFDLQTPEGVPIDAEYFAGKIVVLEFFTMDCGACFQLFPEIDRLARHFKNDPEVMVIAVHPDTDPRLLKQKPLADYSFPAFVDADLTMADQVNLRGVPVTYLINTDGRPVLKHLGYNPRNEAAYFADDWIRRIEALKQQQGVQHTLP